MTQLNWWQQVVFYQIYPRSFADGNADGIGDFSGMIAKLDYLKSLGVEGIWLSPHYPSPLFDCGYDIADYTAIDPDYGTLADFKQFLDGLHQRGMYLILDLVLNHTSDKHPWFIESRSSHTNTKRDWYIWKDGKNGNPPNNWNSTFGGSAWEYDPVTDQYYYHYFFKEQPDLNWRNPQVKQAMFDAVRFWLDLGVDGFRLDAIGTIFEDPNLPDQQSPLTLDELYQAGFSMDDPEANQQLMHAWTEMFKYQTEQPGMHELLQELRTLINEYPNRMLVGESEEISYMGDGTNELHMVFNFPLMQTEKLTPAHIRQNQRQRLGQLPPGGWACNTLGNHDSPRVRSRYGVPPAFPIEQARLWAALPLTLKGTPFIYNGEEIGMTDFTLTDLSQFRDMLGVHFYNTAVNKFGIPPQQALQMAASRGTRDRNRTPMQWENSPNSGFSPQGVTPWLPVNPNYTEGINVSDQEKDQNSLLNFYRRIIHFRHATPALVHGDYHEVHPESEEYLAFLRVDSITPQTCLVVMNFSANVQTTAAFAALSRGVCIFSTHGKESQLFDSSSLHLEPYEIFIAELYPPLQKGYIL